VQPPAGAPPAELPAVSAPPCPAVAVDPPRPAWPAPPRALPPRPPVAAEEPPAPDELPPEPAPAPETELPPDPPEPPVTLAPPAAAAELPPASAPATVCPPTAAVPALPPLPEVPPNASAVPPVSPLPGCSALEHAGSHAPADTTPANAVPRAIRRILLSMAMQFQLRAQLVHCSRLGSAGAIFRRHDFCTSEVAPMARFQVELERTSRSSCARSQVPTEIPH